MNVTTRELAAHAGVAEGTLFSVFDDKRSLLLAAIAHGLEPTPVVDALQALSNEPSLEEKLLGVVEVVQPRLDAVHAFAVALHSLGTDGTERGAPKPTYLQAWLRAVAAGVAELLSQHAAELTVAPALVARMFTTLLFATRFQHPESEQWPAPEVLVRSCLFGVVAGRELK